MKAWLPVLLEALPLGPILALTAGAGPARAAVLNPGGETLAGGLGSPALTAQAAEEARSLRPGESRLLSRPAGLILERLKDDPETRRFWTGAGDNQAGAWAAWLLTIPRLEPEGLRLTRHFLSAFGPWTDFRLPEELKERGALTPLKAGLGRLFVLGDDALALETAWLAARAGLTVSWLTAMDQRGPELDEALALADFDLLTLESWPDLTADQLRSWGFADGVRLVITAADQESLRPALAEFKPAYMILSGEAGGLFPQARTTTQKALGLVAELLR